MKKRSNQAEPLRFAYYCLLLFMVVYFGRPEDWIPGMANVPLAKITGIPIVLALFVSISKIRWQFPLEIIFVTLLMVQLWLSVPFSPVWRGGAFGVMVDFSKVLPLVLVMYWTVRSMSRLRWILFVQAVSAALVAIISVGQARISLGRLVGVLSGIYGNSNDLAVVVDLSIPLCLAFMLTTKGSWKKAPWAVAIVIMIYAVFLTASRAGAISLVVSAVFCLWRLGIKSRYSYLLLLLPVAVILIWTYAGNGLRDRFEAADAKSEAYQSAQESTEQRKELLFQSLRVTGEYPVFGVGPGNFIIVSGAWHVAHNSYTQMSSEGGIPAFILYILIFLRGIMNLRDIRRFKNPGREFGLFSMALEATLAAYLLGSFFASLQYQLFPYCLVAYTTALRLIVMKERATTSKVLEAKLAPAGVSVLEDPTSSIKWQ
jgi:hypothetical protein